MFKKLITIISLIFFCASCSKSDNEILPILDIAESLMEQHPDSSLFLLNTINLNDISANANKARYALLKSIALDKNYIDVDDDSLTSIAVAYYSKHGDADERLTAYLYNGKVYVNAKDYELAMNNYLYAEESVESCTNNIIIGRLYSLKSVLYNTIFDTYSAIEQSRLATEYFLKGGDTVRFLNHLNNMAVIMHNSSSFDSISVEKYTKQIETYWYRLTPKQKKTYFSIQLERIPKTDTVTITSMIDKYLTSNLGDDNINWLSVADAYFKVGDINESLNSVKKYKLNGGNTDVTYYSILSDIFSIQGKYKLAYDYLVKSTALLQGRYYKAVKSDTKFLEERYASNMQNVQQRHTIVSLVMTIVIIVLFSLLLRKHYKTVSLKHQLKIVALEKEARLHQQELDRMSTEKENYELKCREAIKEQEKLKDIIKSNKSNGALNSEILFLVKQRLAILDKFIAANISSAYSKEAMQELNQLMQDRRLFLESTRISYSLSHPKFVEFLYSKELTDREVACCCLYCIGLNGSEISNYLEMKSFYNLSKVIRKKLSVERTINIDTHLRILLEKFNQ